MYIVTIFMGLKTFLYNLQVCVDCCLLTQGSGNGVIKIMFFFVLIIVLLGSDRYFRGRYIVATFVTVFRVFGRFPAALILCGNTKKEAALRALLCCLSLSSELHVCCHVFCRSKMNSISAPWGL